MPFSEGSVIRSLPSRDGFESMSDSQDLDGDRLPAREALRPGLAIWLDTGNGLSASSLCLRRTSSDRSSQACHSGAPSPV
jgi:hypothetical protein